MNASFLLLAALFPTPTSGIDHGVLPFQLLLLFERDWIFPEESYWGGGAGGQESALRAACSFNSDFSQNSLTKLNLSLLQDMAALIFQHLFG